MAGLFLLLSATSLNTQVLRKKYDLYFLEKGNIYPLGVYLVNDTLFITTSGLPNVISIQRERDSVWSAIGLKSFREPNAKKDTTKEKPAAIKKKPIKKS